MYQNFERQNSREEYRINYRDEDYIRSRDRNRSTRERSSSSNFSNDRNNRSTSNNKSRSGSRESTNRDKIRCYKCREYDHFTKDCPTSREERELEQVHQMFNLNGEQTSHKVISNKYTRQPQQNRLKENLGPGHLNL